MATKKIAKPEAGDQIEKIKHDADIILSKLESVMSITDAEGEARASEFMLQIQRRYKLVDDKRKQYVQPLNDQVKVINNDFKMILGPLDEALKHVKTALSAWRNGQAFKEAEERRLEIEASAKDAVRAGDAVAVAGLVEDHREAAAEAPRIVRATSGSVSFRDEQKFEVVDPLQVPYEYLVVDERLIRAAVKAGKLVIPGVKIWTEKVPVGRS